jgi:hypothetical protein
MELLHVDEQTDMAKLTGAKRCDMHVIRSTGKEECWKTINKWDQSREILQGQNKIDNA